MGLFKFVKDAGAKVLNKITGKDKREKAAAEKLVADQEAAQDVKEGQQEFAIKTLMESHGFCCDTVSIEVDGEIVKLWGEIDTQEEKEKLILIAGNIEGIAGVDENISVLNPTPEARYYTVVKGDTLWKISAEMYGNGSKYPVIFEANKPMLEHPDKIYPGQVLRVPELA